MGMARWWQRAVRVGLAAAVMATAVQWTESASQATAAERETVIAGLQSGTDPATLDPLLAAYGAWATRRSVGLSIESISVAKDQAPALRAALQRQPLVVAVEEPQQLAAATAPPTPLLVNDPLMVAGRQWSLGRIQAAEAWSLLPANGKTMVAVLDTGIDFRHPDLEAKIEPWTCNTYRGICGPTSSVVFPDPTGHGSHVAGIIGADTSNSIGVAGVSGGHATLLSVPISSVAGRADTFDIAVGIEYAVERGAKVINLSFGGPCGSVADVPRQRAIMMAEMNDVLIVVSAGNDGGCWEGRYPNTDPRVMSVAATDQADGTAEFSSRGQFVTVAAPGKDILSTTPVRCSAAGGICDPSGYAVASGTSMAAPHVAGLAAMLYTVPGATKAKVVEWITSTCDSANVAARCGGRINAYRAVALAVTGQDPAKPAPLAPAATTPTPDAPPAPTTSDAPAP